MAALGVTEVADGVPCPACSHTTWLVTIVVTKETPEPDLLVVEIEPTTATCKHCGHSVGLDRADAPTVTADPVA